MIKKIISLAIILGISVTVIGLSLSGLNSEEITSEEINSEEASLETEEMMKADVLIPTKVSRPGCDIEDICYIPSYQYYTLSFDEIGTFDYFCELHPWMFAQVIVE